MMTVSRLSLLPLLLLASSVVAQSGSELSGEQIMQEVQRRNLQEANIYEEMTVIMTDRMGYRDTRDIRRYSRTDKAGSSKLLLMIDTPDDVHGVALLANRDTSGQTSVMIYLPAVGQQKMQQIESGQDDTIISTDFSVEQLLGEQPGQYQYVLSDQQKSADILYYLVDVYPAGSNLATALPIKRHHIRQDGFYITRTDYFGPDGQLLKQKTLYDLKQMGKESWRAGMVLMENFARNHSTLLKIRRTIFSEEYVPDEVFTYDWLYRNQPPLLSAETIEAEISPDMTEPAVESGAR